MMTPLQAAQLDGEQAYVFGLLHDIGRRAGVTGILHIFDGYDYMMTLNQSDIARICLTHSFPVKTSIRLLENMTVLPSNWTFLQSIWTKHRMMTTIS